MFARSIARQASRAVQQAARRSVMPAMPAMAARGGSASLLCSNFSSGADADDIASILRNQLAEELEVNSGEGKDQEFLDVKEQVLSLFKQNDTVPGKSNFVLTRKYNNETITIEYDVQDQEVVEKNFEDYTEEQMQSMQEEDMEGEHGVRFSVTVKKDGANKSIIFDMLTTGDIQISNIMVLPDGETKDNNDLYSGPNFGELDEKLQSSWYAYLEERGIDNDLVYYIMFSTNEKEQKEYENWLDKCAEFVEK